MVALTIHYGPGLFQIGQGRPAISRYGVGISTVYLNGIVIPLDGGAGGCGVSVLRLCHGDFETVWGKALRPPL